MEIASQPAPPMACGDRLSVLSDDLLRRVLHFAPAKVAASTSALSRRWRSLWRSSAAVNLETFVPDEEFRSFRCGSGRYDDEAFFSRRYDFVSAADAALAAAAIPVTRLTFRVETDGGEGTICKFLERDRDWWSSRSVVGELLSHPAARRVEELRLAAIDRCGLNVEYDHEVNMYRGGYELSFGSLPSVFLRVLDLTNSRSLTPPTAVAFPRLTSLRLRHCAVTPGNLQNVIDAAPSLATVHLESTLVAGTDSPSYGRLPPPPEDYVARLRCPAATALVLEKCSWTNDGNRQRHVAVEIDAPRLRRFRYKGYLRQFSLSSPAPDLARVDLHFFPGGDRREKDPSRDRVNFWRFVGNFTNAKELKLRVNHLKDIAVVNEERQAKLLCAFRNLERLELEGVHKPASKTAAVAIANLLHCCPVIRDLRIKLSTTQSDSSKNSSYGHDFLKRKYRSDLDKSIDHYTRRRSMPILSLEGDDDDVNYDEVSDIPGLSEHSFNCLQSCLRRVGLQFRMGKENCFGVKLIKFFAENAMVLEELCIDAGNRKICEHINDKVERWIADSSKSSLKRKSSMESSPEFCMNQSGPSKFPRKSLDPTRGIRVLPLER